MITPPWPRSPRRYARCFVLVLLILPSLAAAQWPDGESGSFDGFWAMSGTVHIIELPDRGFASAGGLTGTVTIQTDQGAVPSFESDCVVFADTRSKGVGRCVWTATTGDQVVVDLESNGPAGSGSVQGVFSGGTGRFRSLTGRFRFEWNYSVSGGQDADLDGNTYAMRGHYDMRGR